MGNLYHGSYEKGIKRLEPHQSTHGNYVYATPYKELAIIFSGRCGDDCTYALYRNSENDPWKLVERIPEAFNTMYKNSSSIYTLDDSTFKDINTGFAEVVSEVGVDIINEEYIENVYDEIKKLASEGKVELYIYPNKPKEIPSDSSDLIDKQIRQQKRNNKPVSKECFARILLLHPYLIDKINKKMIELNINATPYKKEDIINLFEIAVTRQSIDLKREQYLNSIIISINNTFPELLPYINQKIEFLDIPENDKKEFAKK
jgi:hypothetical protein